MKLNEEISDFIRDAQWKLIEMSIYQDQDNDFSYGEAQIKRSLRDRWELYIFMWLLYNNRYNYSEDHASLLDWTEEQISAEIQYLRNRFNMNPVPVMFNSARKTVLRFIEQNSGNLPEGIPGYILGWNQNNEPVPVPVKSIVGAITDVSPEQYFS